ncbi:MAG: hypothetical protein DYG88_09045 [Chloroflexi bacterium CFX4]|nr:hypothetical protein [Chloroflexi bacterium CFX4]MDL1922239.1 hypothetical protein [Chloroflexi bacterium CFX3]
MNTRQILLGGLLGVLLSGAGLAIAAGGIALLGIEIGVVGLRLTPDDIPNDLRGALVLGGFVGILIWLICTAVIGLRALRRKSPRHPALTPTAHEAAALPWYSGTPTIPHFTPPIPPPEQAYLSVTRPSPTFSPSDTRPQRPVPPTNVEHTQVPAMPSLLSYESLFPPEQTEQFVPPPLPNKDDTPDSAPTVPPPTPTEPSIEIAPPAPPNAPDE